MTTYEETVTTAKAACAEVRNAEDSAKRLPSYRLEAGERIRAAYKAGEAEGKTKADVAKDLGYSERWVRELAAADTPEKAAKAKAANAKANKKHRAASRDAGRKAKIGKHDVDLDALSPAAQAQIDAALDKFDEDEEEPRRGGDDAFQQALKDTGELLKEAPNDELLATAQARLATKSDYILDAILETKKLLDEPGWDSTIADNLIEAFRALGDIMTRLDVVTMKRMSSLMGDIEASFAAQKKEAEKKQATAITEPEPEPAIGNAVGVEASAAARRAAYEDDLDVRTVAGGTFNRAEEPATGNEPQNDCQPLPVIATITDVKKPAGRKKAATMDKAA